MHQPRGRALHESRRLYDELAPQSQLAARGAHAFLLVTSCPSLSARVRNIPHTAHATLLSCLQELCWARPSHLLHIHLCTTASLATRCVSGERNCGKNGNAVPFPALLPTGVSRTLALRSRGEGWGPGSSISGKNGNMPTEDTENIGVLCGEIRTFGKKERAGMPLLAAYRPS